MAAPPIGSLLVGSSQPNEMKTWYKRAFGVSENDTGAFEFGGIQLFVEEHSDVSGPTKEPARIIINLDVSDAQSLNSHLKDMGAKFIREPEHMPFGLISTVADPDGNYVQVIEWGATPEAHKG
jgi:predicted enzyme related to lactoylglutathione lyase